MLTRTDYLIIGAGPGGLQLAYYLARRGRDYIVLEGQAMAGSFFAKFPRHRKLISVNKVHTGGDDPEFRLRFDWNSLLSDDERDRFTNYSERYFPDASDLVRYLQDFVARHALNVRYETTVSHIFREGDEFRVLDADRNEYQARFLIVATGNYKPFLPAIEGIELTEKYNDVSIDPKDFVNQRVLIIGKGNSAFETADNLTETASLIHLASPTPLQFAWKTHFVGHLRAVNNNLLDNYQLKLQNAVLDATIERITRREDGKFVVSVHYTHAQNEREDLVYDRVITCTGFRFDDSIFDPTCRPALTINDRFPQQTPAWESTNVKNLFFAGALMQARDFKKSSSGFIHGFRYNAHALHNILEHRFHGQPLPHRLIDVSPESFAATITDRINISSALWLQFGFLADIIEISDDGSFARYYEDLPFNYFLESEIAQMPCYSLTLEFGKIEGDPFAVPRFPDPSLAHHSTFLHPVIRRFEAGELVAEFHVLENLYGEWNHPELHIKPMIEFFRLSGANSQKSVAISPVL